MLCWFFFFKQKTAYEVRISDWSSDVCSSDLVGHAFGGEARHVAEEGHDVGRGEPGRRAVVRGRDAKRAERGGMKARHAPELARHFDRRGDRKSAVEGKSVSVREDIGGGSTIKKKKVYSLAMKKYNIVT